jgi:hypothetical protein
MLFLFLVLFAQFQERTFEERNIASLSISYFLSVNLNDLSIHLSIHQNVFCQRTKLRTFAYLFGDRESSFLPPKIF